MSKEIIGLLGVAAVAIIARQIRVSKMRQARKKQKVVDLMNEVADRMEADLA